MKKCHYCDFKTENHREAMRHLLEEHPDKLTYIEKQTFKIVAK